MAHSAPRSAHDTDKLEMDLHTVLTRQRVTMRTGTSSGWMSALVFVACGRSSRPPDFLARTVYTRLLLRGGQGMCVCVCVWCTKMPV